MTVSLLGVAVLVPVLPAVAVLIKLESDGPVFRKELLVGSERRRNGSDERGSRRLHDAKGRLFKLRSFRTRHVGTGDPTRVGTVLSWTGLDRLPRLLSVLNGDMSLVGPRASSPDFLDELHRRHPAAVRRVGGVKPGLFGYAPRSRHATPATFYSRLADRLYLDSVYCERLEACTGLDVLVLDLLMIARELVPLAGSMRALRRGHRVRVEHPARFSTVDLQPEQLTNRLPARREARAEGADHGLTVSWDAGLRPAVGWPSLDESTLEATCDDVLLTDGQLRVAFHLDRRDGQGRDLVRLELPVQGDDFGAACLHLEPLWESLAARSTEAGFADRVQAALLEGLALVASRARPGTELLVVQAEVEPGRLGLTFDAVPAPATAEPVSAPRVASAG